MKPTFIRWSIVPAVALAVFAACSEHGGPTEQVVGPDQAAFSKASESAPGLQKKGQVKVRGRNGTEATYVLVNGQGGLSATRTVYPGRRVAEVVDIALPGIGGVRVPVTAVSKPTTFTIRTENRTAADGAEFLAVDLQAVTEDANRTDVGRAGFHTDVTLYLTKPAQIASVSGATILWQVGADLFREVQCRSVGGVDAEGAGCVTDTGSTLEARLRHFSAYVIANADD